MSTYRHNSNLSFTENVHNSKDVSQVKTNDRARPHSLGGCGYVGLILIGVMLVMAYLAIGQAIAETFNAFF